MRRNSFEKIPFDALDGFKLNLLRALSVDVPTKGPILLVHGAGVRANIFNAPTECNIVSTLLNEGYDVWLENWRGSIDFEPNEWNLDQVARFDHPAAVATIEKFTGCSQFPAIIHCQGSTSFTISAALGLVPQITTIISNAVSLHPRLSPFSRFKIFYVVPLVSLLTKYLNPQWGDNAPTLFSKLVRLMVKITHRENDTMVGKMVSFTYGYGFPALWELKNISETVGQWIRKEFAHVPMTFFSQMSKSVRNGALVPANKEFGFSGSYADNTPKTDARFVFFTGALNKCFHPDSQRVTYNYFNDLKEGYHGLHVIPEYSHLDIFYGTNAHKDVFPLMLKELEQKE